VVLKKYTPERFLLEARMDMCNPYFYLFFLESNFDILQTSTTDKM